MKKTFIGLFAVISFGIILSIGMCAFASTRSLSLDSEGDFYYDSASKFAYLLDSTEYTAEVIGNPSGTTSGFTYGSVADCIIPSAVSFGGKTYNVTSVADDAFCDHTTLEGVAFESDVKIGSRAFMGCTALANLSLSGVTSIGDGAFSYIGVTALSLPASITAIGKNAFYYASKIETIDGINSSNIKYIGAGAFSGTKWLGNQTSVFVLCGDGIIVKYNGGSGDIVIPAEAKGIAGGFSGNSNITAVDFSEADGLKYIGSNAFYGCRSITSVSIPDSVEQIGDMAFSSCGSLNSVILGAGIKAIDFCAFSGCTALESVMCSSENLEYVGECAFWNCPSLVSASFASFPEIIDLGAFWKTGLTSFDIPDGVKTIGKGAFSSVEDIKLIIPKSVVNIDGESFADTAVSFVCAPNSAAAEYARVNFSGSDNLSVAKYFGDLNGDGAVTIADFELFIKSFAGNSEAVIEDAEVADTAFDGITSLKDLSAMMKYLAGEADAKLGK